MMAVASHIAAPRASGRCRERLVIRGTVQGVGFRPYLYRRAVAHRVGGYVMNSPQGVIAEVEGSAEAVAAFVSGLQTDMPPNAVVNGIDRTTLAACGDHAFEIRKSRARGPQSARVLPDLATCRACLDEIFNPSDRRYLYPFTNCTDCGPRYSLIAGLPYDRARTSMRDFVMCAACQNEYDDPTDRRFHAEPNACPACGPQLTFRDGQGRDLARRHEALLAAAEALRKGLVLAVKGLGGFHLMTDARNAAAVARLRAAKGRPHKPFAVMMPSLADVEAACTVSAEEAALLTGRERPIVLLRRRGRHEAATTAGVAPENPKLGVMLAYTPLHHILMAEIGFPVVATSGNASDEPIAIDEADAMERLGEIADGFLVHDRAILRPVDDSVTRVLRGRPQVLRRARGYAPAPIPVDGLMADVMACGGHLKATIALTRKDEVILSQHIGDLDSAAARDAYDRTGADLRRLHAVRPRLLACDRHPDYQTTVEAESLAGKEKIPLISVQHHLAHVAACMGEHDLKGPVLGVAWDGSGFGADGMIWGGEFLLVTGADWRRIGHFRPFPLPGGTTAIREPRRAALGLLLAAYGDRIEALGDLAPIHAFAHSQLKVLRRATARGVNAPMTTSAGRLFDAAASLTGLCQVASYEGQGACALEWAMSGRSDVGPYDFPIRSAPEGAATEWVVDWQPAFDGLINDLRADRPVDEISAAFHRGMAVAVARFAALVGVETVALTGGCFQNAALSELAIAGVQRAGHKAYLHQTVPANDGGLAFGQAVWASRFARSGEN